LRAAVAGSRRTVLSRNAGGRIASVISKKKEGMMQISESNGGKQKGSLIEKGATKSLLRMRKATVPLGALHGNANFAREKP